MWTTPEKHTKKRETLRNANQHKTTRIAEYEKVYEKNSERKHSELNDQIWWKTEQNKKTNNSQTEEAQRKSPKMNQSNWKGALQKPLWEEQSPTKC